MTRFVRRVNYGVPVSVEYFSNKKFDAPAAQIVFSRAFNDVNQSLNPILWCYIKVNKALKKHLKDITLKSILVHEVGHIHTGTTIKNKKLLINPEYMREYEAQVWAIKRAKSMKMYGVKRRLIQGFMDWRRFKWNGVGRVYKKAWKIAVKNCIIKK